MKNQIDIVKDIADGMIEIGGIPSNEEFYAEFDMRVRAALRIPDGVGRGEYLSKNPCTLNQQACSKGSGCKYPHCQGEEPFKEAGHSSEKIFSFTADEMKTNIEGRHLMRCVTHPIARKFKTHPEKLRTLAIQILENLKQASKMLADECVLHSPDMNGRCFKCDEQVFEREPK